MAQKNSEHRAITRRKFLSNLAAVSTGAVGLPAWAQQKSNKTGTVRVWGEPGPYGGVAVDAMNEWAKKFAPGIAFKLETLSWDSVYVKLMTDLAARNPAHCISVESPIAYQLMADLLLEPLDDVVEKVGRNRLIDGVKWEYWGAWKGKQYVLPAHHQPHLLVVRMDVINELGLGDPDKWDWNDLRNAARTVSEKKKDMAGISLALGRNLCTDYHFAALLHAAGGRMFDPANKYQVVFDSPETVEALEYVKSLQPYMPKGAVSYSFLEVVDSIVTGRAAISFYWGRPYGRAAEENKAVFASLQSFNHARHPKTGRRSNWNDFQGWCIPKANNQYVAEVKAALAYYQTSPQWLVRYCHSLMPNVSPTYKDVLNDPTLATHPFFQTKKETIMNYYVHSLAHSSSTANEMLKGINPLAGVVHGRSILAQTVQKVAVDNWKAADAAKWARELEQVRKENLRLLGGAVWSRAPGTSAGDDWRKADRRIGILFIVPFVVAALVFMVYPVAEAVRLAFYHYNPLNPDGTSFAGLDNFRALAADPLFWQSFRQAAVWTVCSIVLQTAIGVALALLLHLPLRGISIFRGLLLFPYIVPTVVIALILQWMLNAEVGVVNWSLRGAGLIDENVYWLASPGLAMLSTIALNVWKYTPFVTICVLARLQTIPLELYDAAKVDGAGTFRRFADITLPQLADVLAVVVIFRTIWTFNKFEEIYLLTRGGPGTSTFNLAIYSFEQSVASLKLGVGAATGVVMMGLLFVGSLVYVRVFRFDEEPAQ